MSPLNVFFISTFFKASPTSLDYVTAELGLEDLEDMNSNSLCTALKFSGIINMNDLSLKLFGSIAFLMCHYRIIHPVKSMKILITMSFTTSQKFNIPLVSQ